MIIKVKYIRIILSPNLVAFSCIWILYGGLDAWPINTEILGMALLFWEYGMSQTIGFHCNTIKSSHLRPGQYLWIKPKLGKNFAFRWQFFIGGENRSTQRKPPTNWPKKVITVFIISLYCHDIWSFAFAFTPTQP